MKACTQCGRCCTNADFMSRLQASEDDRARWRNEGRTDILARVDDLGMWIMADGDTACPFIARRPDGRTFGCTIYDTRPETCRDYPLAVAHMLFVNCDMLDPEDTDDHVRRFMQRENTGP